jgi:hypothetical protein
MDNLKAFALVQLSGTGITGEHHRPHLRANELDAQTQ